MLRWLLAAAAAILASAGSAGAVALTTKAITVNGEVRTYCQYDPPGVPASAPVVLDFHGGAPGITCATAGARWAAYAEATGAFIVLAPLGKGGAWNACSKPPEVCSNPLWANDQRNDDDIGFVDALLTLHSGRPAFVSGMSAGGMMVYSIACHLSAKIEAALAVAASSRVQSCPGGPVPFLHMHGNEDGHVPWDGGPPNNYPPVQPGLDARALVNDCTLPATGIYDPAKKRTAYAYTACLETVEFYRYTCQHNWPKPTPWWQIWWDALFGLACNTSWTGEADGWAFFNTALP